MKIRPDDYQEILSYMLKQRSDGNEFVAFLNDSEAATREGLFCFKDHYETKEFCYESSTDRDVYGYMAIRSVYRAMSEALQDKSQQIRDQGLIDISAMVSERITRLESQELNNNQNNIVMNEKNLEYLQNQVKFTGFGEGLSDSLKQQIVKGGEDFKLQHSAKFGNDTVSAELNFSKSKQSDMYFFNNYDVSLKKDNNDEELKQTFYINQSGSITLKEAYNLMEGRAVNKDLKTQDKQDYNAWLQIDFRESDAKGNFKLKSYSENYGYDIEAALAKHPIRELTSAGEKEDLINSLKKGNLQSVTFEKEGKEEKHYIEANPKFKTINVYDSNMAKMDKTQSQSEKQSQGESKSTKQDNKQSQSAASEDGGAEKPKAENKKKARQSIK